MGPMTRTLDGSGRAKMNSLLRPQEAVALQVVARVRRLIWKALCSRTSVNGSWTWRPRIEGVVKSFVIKEWRDSLLPE